MSKRNYPNVMYEVGLGRVAVLSNRILFLAILLLLPGPTVWGQAQFKRTDDSTFKTIKAEEKHRLAAIEELVQATRNYENLGERKDVTVLAPNNRAFKRLPTQTLDYLNDNTHLQELNDLIAYHSLEGEFTEKQIRSMIKKGDGTASFKTVAGFTLRAILDKEEAIIFIDHNNRKMRLVEPDYSKGGHIVHIIDGVILPHSAVY